MSVSPSDTAADVMIAMERLMAQVEAALEALEPERLVTLARRQAALLNQLKALPVPRESADALSRTLARSRRLGLRIEEEMEAIRSLLTASANKKRIHGAYTSTR